MLSRRVFVGKLAAGAAGAAAAFVGGGRATALAKATGLQAGEHGEGRLFPAPEAPASHREAHAAATTTAAPPLTASAPPPWELLRPLTLGAVVAHGWRVADLTGVTDGACVLTLQNGRGRTHRVHLCRNDGRPQGIVYTRCLDLVVMNGGQGDQPTDEGLAQAVAEVAHVLAANEDDWRQQTMVTALLPHAERLRLFTGSADGRLR